MNDVALVTANFGEIDDLKPLPRHDGVDAFYYTDAGGFVNAAPTAVATWTRVLVPNYPRYDFGSRMRSRYFKHQIHRLDEVQRHRWLVWADSAFQFHDMSFVLGEVERLRRLPPRKRFLFIPHPDRRTILQEYEFIDGAIKDGSEYFRVRYGHEKMTEQMEHFRQSGWNLEAHLVCGGLWIVEHSDLMQRCWDAWWDQVLRYGMMDQLSLPVMLEEFGCEAQTFDVSVWKNPHFTHVGHCREM